MRAGHPSTAPRGGRHHHGTLGAPTADAGVAPGQRIARTPRGLFVDPLFRGGGGLCLVKELLPTSSLEGQAYSDPAGEPSALPSRVRIGVGLLLACTAPLSLPHALLALVLNTSAARWLTRTRLCCQRKKNGKLRPIKMEELLRSAFAKWPVNPHQVILRSKVLRMHQWASVCPAQPLWPTASRPTWILSTCLAVLSGHAFAKLSPAPPSPPTGS